ncbi:MAG: hypothetical protein JWO67_4004 [Streptosporangiaceae bacterium]|nr:hypothetical protein [Streptosporangiaceae bacterium]
MKHWDTVERSWHDVVRCLLGRHEIAESDYEIAVDSCSCGARQFDRDGNWSQSISVGRRSARRAWKNAEDRKWFRAQVLAAVMGPLKAREER